MLARQMLRLRAGAVHGRSLIAKRMTSTFSSGSIRGASHTTTAGGRGAVHKLIVGASGVASAAFSWFLTSETAEAAPATATTTATTQSKVVTTSKHQDKDGNEWVIDRTHFDDMSVFSGRANVPLAKEIAARLGVGLGKISIKGYADGEIGIQVLENVRGKDVYIIQPTCPGGTGVNDHLMELLLMISTMRRASARKITAIIPYYGYARQDRKMDSRVPISAADVARLIESMGVDRVVAVDLHCGQIQGFFGPRTPCDNLEAQIAGIEYFAREGFDSETTKVISPDAGGVYRAKKFRDGLKELGIDAGLAMIIKQRVKANSIERMDLVGDVTGNDVIIVDDMIDTAGTLCSAAAELKNRGAKRVYAFATHGVFSGPAYERINSSVMEKVVVTNTVPLNPNKVAGKITQLSIADILAEAIARIHLKKSVSALFSKQKSEE